MARTLNGVVLTVKTKTAVVEVTRRVPHPKYKKLLKRSKKFTAVLNGQNVKVGDNVDITETRPMTKSIHFILNKENKKEVAK